MKEVDENLLRNSFEQALQASNSALIGQLRDLAREIIAENQAKARAEFEERIKDPERWTQDTETRLRWLEARVAFLNDQLDTLQRRVEAIEARLAPAGKPN
jgi:hypothetical protein